MFEIFDDCVPVAKLVELYASGEHLPLCLCYPDKLVGSGCACHFVKASYTTAYCMMDTAIKELHVIL